MAWKFEMRKRWRAHWLDISELNTCVDIKGNTRGRWREWTHSTWSSRSKCWKYWLLANRDLSIPFREIVDRILSGVNVASGDFVLTSGSWHLWRRQSTSSFWSHATSRHHSVLSAYLSRDGESSITRGVAGAMPTTARLTYYFWSFFLWRPGRRDYGASRHAPVPLAPLC